MAGAAGVTEARRAQAQECTGSRKRRGTAGQRESQSARRELCACCVPPHTHAEDVRSAAYGEAAAASQCAAQASSSHSLAPQNARMRACVSEITQWRVREWWRAYAEAGRPAVFPPARGEPAECARARRYMMPRASRARAVQQVRCQ